MMHIHVDASPDAAGSSEIPRSRPDYRPRLGLGTLVEDAAHPNGVTNRSVYVKLKRPKGTAYKHSIYDTEHGVHDRVSSTQQAIELLPILFHRSLGFLILHLILQ